MNWFCSSSSKNLFVKIVHPGGHVELHDRPILAAELLNRNPKCCVAHPTVFQHPHDVVSPETTLHLGKKYYIVPLGTIRKLQLKHSSRRHHVSTGRHRISSDDHSSSSCWLFRNGKNGEIREKIHGNGGGSSGTKIRAASSESSGDDTMEVIMMRRESGGGDGATSSPGRITLVSMDNWQPGLHSIREDY